MKPKYFQELAFKPLSIQYVYDTVTSGFSIQDVGYASLSTIIILSIYYVMSRHITEVKPRAWIITLQSSTVLGIAGTIHVMRTIYLNAWTLEDIYTENPLSRFMVIYFTIGNILDLAVGVNDYPAYLDPFSTIAHHVFYVGFMICLLVSHYSTGFILCFFMEIPTSFLSLGIISKDLRSDALFGVSFLIARIIYNAFLAYQLRSLSPSGIIWKVCVGVFCLHLYWFNKWVKIYGTAVMTDLRKSASSSLLTSTLPGSPSAIIKKSADLTEIATRISTKGNNC